MVISINYCLLYYLRVIKKTNHESGKFSAELYSQIYPDGSEKHYWTYSRNLIIENTLRFNNLTHGTILDIGAGRGITVDYLVKRGFDSYGCDLGSPKVYAEVKKRFFSAIDAFDLPLSFRSKINTILLLDVLEHMEKPDIFLSKCRKEFPNLKAIVATVPARMEIWSNYDEFYGHFRRYDLTRLQETFVKSGFTVLQNNYFFHLLYAAAWSLLRIKKRRGLHLGHVSQTWLHRIIGEALFLEHKFIPKKWIGTSILIVAKVK